MSNTLCRPKDSHGCCRSVRGTYMVRGPHGLDSSCDSSSQYLLKKAGASLLPAANLHRRKMGFGVPVGDWMRRELRPLLEEVLLSPQAAIRQYCQPEPLAELVRQHVTGTNDHSDQLWAVLWLGLWHKERMDNAG